MHHNDLLASYLKIGKKRELIVQKYYWEILKHNVKTYIKWCDICLALKTVKDKPYKDLQLLPVLIYGWKDLSMDFITGLLILTNWKNETYDSILVIIDRLIKMIYDKLVSVTIHASNFTKMSIDMIIQYQKLPDSILSESGPKFISRFWSSFYYFLEIKKRLLTAFYLQTNGQTER